MHSDVPFVSCTRGSENDPATLWTVAAPYLESRRLEGFDGRDRNLVG